MFALKNNNSSRINNSRIKVIPRPWALKSPHYICFPSPLQNTFNFKVVYTSFANITNMGDAILQVIKKPIRPGAIEGASRARNKSATRSSGGGNFSKLLMSGTCCWPMQDNAHSILCLYKYTKEIMMQMIHFPTGAVCTRPCWETPKNRAILLLCVLSSSYSQARDRCSCNTVYMQ